MWRRVQRCLQKLMSGNHPVVAANHTVILNWNRETIPLLRQIAICQLERGSDAFQGCTPDSPTLCLVLLAVRCHQITPCLC